MNNVIAFDQFDQAIEINRLDFGHFGFYTKFDQQTKHS